MPEFISFASKVGLARAAPKSEPGAVATGYRLIRDFLGKQINRNGLVFIADPVATAPGSDLAGYADVLGKAEFIRNMPLLELSRVDSLMYSEDFRTGRTLFSKGALMAEEYDPSEDRREEATARFVSHDDEWAE